MFVDDELPPGALKLVQVAPPRTIRSGGRNSKASDRHRAMPDNAAEVTSAAAAAAATAAAAAASASAAVVATAAGFDPKLEVRSFFASISPDARGAPPPPAAPLPCERTLASTLHGYQRQAVEWAQARERAGVDDAGVCGGVLAEEMGLGKSVEVIGLVQSHQCPLSESLADATSGGRIPHCSGLLLPRVSAGGETCNLCGRKSLPSETVHEAAASGYRCCSWCFMPYQPGVACAPPPRASSDATDASTLDSSAAPSRRQDGRLPEDGSAPAVQPPQAQRRRVVRFGDDEEEQQRPPSVVEPPSSAPPLLAARSAAPNNSADPSSSAAPNNSADPNNPADPNYSGFKIRIKRPRPADGDAPATSKLAAGVGAPPQAPRPPPPCMATLIVAPASIHRQWLEEINKHAPSLLARVVVYPGLRELSSGADAARLAEAVDRACVVLTTYRVLRQEVYYQGGEGEAEADGHPCGRRLRGAKRYELPSSPLLLRTYWRLVIDEAQAVQGKTASPSQLALMSMRIHARHRWCARGMPPSPTSSRLPRSPL